MTAYVSFNTYVYFRECQNCTAVPVGVSTGGILEAEGVRVLWDTVHMLRADKGKVKTHRTRRV